jgi:hypothetical protein
MEAVNPQPHLRAAFGVRATAQAPYKNSISERRNLAIRRFAYVWINPNEDKET